MRCRTENTWGSNKGVGKESQLLWSHQSWLDPVLFAHNPKPMIFTLAIDALWEWETREGRLLPLPALEKRPSTPRGSVRMQTDPIPPLPSPHWCGAGGVGWGDLTLRATTGLCPQPKEQAAGWCVTGLCGGRAGPPCPHPWLSLLQLAGRRTGPSASGGGSPAH